MFGLNEISWGMFLKAHCCLLVGWYALIALLAWYKTKNKAMVLFEDKERDTALYKEEVHSLEVTAQSFPDRILSPLGANTIPLEVSIYEEAWPEDGVQLEYLLEEKGGKLLKQLLPTIQYQQ